VVLLLACNTPNQSKGKAIVSVSIAPQKYFIERLMDTLIEVNVMIPPGASHATYSPTPGQLVKLTHSRAYFLMGHLNFETSWKEKLESANKNMLWYNLSKGIKPIQDSHDHHHDETCSHGTDPHTWTSPREAQIIADNLKAALIDLFPNEKELIIHNYKNFLEDLDSLDSRLLELKQSHPDLTFLIFHPAYTYLANNYGFEQMTIEFEGKTPTPARMQNTIQKAMEKGIKTIYIQQEFDRNNAETIADAIKARTVQVNPLSENWLEEMKRFISYLENQ